MCRSPTMLDQCGTGGSNREKIGDETKFEIIM